MGVCFYKVYRRSTVRLETKKFSRNSAKGTSNTQPHTQGEVMPIPEATLSEVERLLLAGESVRRVAKLTGVGLRSVCKLSAKLNRDGPSVRAVADEKSGTAGSEEESRFEERADGTAVLSQVTLSPVKTLEDACRVAEVDLSVWYVDRWECGAWSVAMNVKGEGGKSKPVTTQQYRVRVYLRRIVSRSVGQALEAIYERLAGVAPRFKSVGKARGLSGGGEKFLAVFGLFDAHFGKLCWAPETGDNYDLKIAEAVFEHAVSDLIDESRHRAIGQILLPIGNDFFHVDNSRNTTFNGTPQDVDGRYWKVIEAGEMAVCRAVEQLQAIAPVQVLWVPGNHDPTTSGHMARTVWAYFRNCQRVNVDRSPSTRKYFQWGASLLGFTHGNEERHADLPNLMANEKPAEHAAATCREWLLGHDHRSKKYTTQPIETRSSTVIRVLQSLAGTDAWHHRRGYVNTRHAAEVYWYGRERGYCGHAIVTARQ